MASRPFPLSFAFRPRILESLKSYTKDDFAADLPAGITVGVIALPLAMAFGIASGVRPDHGLVTAIIGGFLISALGGSKVQIGGPAGAFVALLYGIAEKYGVANLLIATIMAGVLLFAMGALRMGGLIRFIPVSIIIGFTAGIAVIIALSQVKDLLGLAIDKMPSNFFSQLGALWHHLNTVNWVTCVVGLCCLLVIVVWPAARAQHTSRWRRVTAKLPATIVVLVASGLVVRLFNLPVETIGSKFGSLPTGMPFPAMPEFNWATAQNLVAPTIAIAFLSAIESLLCARVADSLTEDRHDPNQELMAQGIANFFVPWFGGIAVTGTIARTVANIRTGARSPVSGIVHSVTLLLVLLLLAPLAFHVPLAALAAILLWVAFNMVDWEELKKLRQFPFFYQVILVSTFLLTVVFDIVTAVEVGLILASLFFIFRISSLTRVEEIPLPAGAAELADGRRVGAFSLYGSLFFASITKFETLLMPGRKLPNVLILEMDHLISMDTTGLDSLEALHRMLTKRYGRLIVAGAQRQPLEMMRRGGFLAALGETNVAPDLATALHLASQPLKVTGSS